MLNEDVVTIITGKDEVLQRATRTYDVETIRGLISNDFTLITSSGRVLDGKDFMAEVADTSVTWFNNDTEDAIIRAYNGDCAVITAVLHQRFESKGKVSDNRVRFTDTWVKRDGSWRYVAGHASLLETLE